MLTGFDTIAHEQEAMQSQIEFLKRCVILWKTSPAQEGNDQKDLTQLVLAICYLKEGLDGLYKQEDDFIQSKLGPSVADEIKIKHQSVMDTLDGVYRSLMGLSDKAEKLNRDYISAIIDGLCRSINMLCLEESQISNTR